MRLDLAVDHCLDALGLGFQVRRLLLGAPVLRDLIPIASVRTRATTVDTRLVRLPQLVSERPIIHDRRVCQAPMTLSLLGE